ncbi:hypothetical protein [Swingsia samuiensis]|uniref:Porin n=1 Tax=Swingsia samuiensis TaxID=1293412 RepID=A0A4Y6UIE7_9PROT|nr:hypothetical protein [Swingsia samuiensis]QDH16824.1 hypothetical protein E3D00_04005 [Swingsia samuiensis]
MTFCFRRTPTLLATSTLISAGIPFAQAHGADQMEIMERQIRAMQAQLNAMKKEHAAEVKKARAIIARQREEAENNPYATRRTYLGPASHFATGGQGSWTVNQPMLAPPRTASTPYGEVTGTPPAHSSLYGPLRRGQIQVGGIRITLGGFAEAAGMWRSRNTASDISTGFNAIPWGNDPAHHMNEFHQSERQSRLAALVEGKITPNLEADGYIETDFQGAGSSSNSRQSNSYVLRTRVFYGELKDRADDLQVLGGQNWSLITMFNKGMSARDEQIPLTIEAQYVPGFNWTRNSQIRIVKGFDNSKYHAGLSIENPSAVPSGTPYEPTGTTVTYKQNGTNVNNPNTYYSTDIAPDVVAKLSADPGWGHYEVTGVLRFLHDRTSKLGGGTSHTTVAGGGGGGLILPLIKKKLYFQASGLVGVGIGRYGTSNIPDYAFNQNGSPNPLPEANALIGLYGNPTKALRLYGYAGAEEVTSRKYFNANGKSYGYGNPLYNMSGCNTELSSVCAAGANVHTVAQATTGFWYDYLKGDYGTIRIGGQYSYTYENAFSAVGGRPHTDDNMFFMSLRYMPFN